MAEPAAFPTRERVANVLRGLWWLPLMRGLLLIILGGYALFRPGMTAVALTQVVGVFVIADGVLAILAGALVETPSRGWTIVRGVVLVLIGLFVFGHAVAVAGVTATLVLYVIASGAIVSGILEIAGTAGDRKAMDGEGWLILSGVLAILFGVLLLIAPLAFGLLIVRILGAYAILYGFALAVLGFRVRKLGQFLRG